MVDTDLAISINNFRGPYSCKVAASDFTALAGVRAKLGKACSGLIMQWQKVV